ncbi:MAG: Rrf2 family transcriptional regulator [Desulfobacteraceae bacterium]|nr:Rrf2 family transcriptional regulator [Desulfobacteraceae bacterium]
MLPQTGIYAIRAMSYIASQQDDAKPLLSRTIAAEMQIPANFLSKILNRLVQAGLIRSIRGRNGGFVMAKPPSEIYIRDIVDLFMQLDSYKRCFLGLNNCDGSCGFHSKWKIISEQFQKMLDETIIDKVR